jgi:hypothetical protein
MTHKVCEPPFWHHPMVLFDSFHLYYRPTCSHSVWNFVARMTILSLFLGMIGSAMAGLAVVPVALLFGVLTAFAIIMLTPQSSSAEYERVPMVKVVDPSGYLAPMKEAMTDAPVTDAPVKEHFVNGGQAKGSIQPVEDPMGREEIDAAPYSGPALPEHTPPTSRNPFMNILLDEYKYNSQRPSAAPVDDPSVEQVMDDYFRIQWHSDPTDVYGKKQSQRQFITQPSTTIPNDQGSFANWLYKIPGKTCKEGGRQACLAMTDNTQFPWMSQF